MTPDCNKDLTKAKKGRNNPARYYGYTRFGGRPNDSHRRRRSLCRTVRPLGGSPQEADAQVILWPASQADALIKSKLFAPR